MKNIKELLNNPEHMICSLFKHDWKIVPDYTYGNPPEQMAECQTCKKKVEFVEPDEWTGRVGKLIHRLAQIDYRFWIRPERIPF